MARGKNCATAAKQLGRINGQFTTLFKPECFPLEGLYYVYQDAVEILAKEHALNHADAVPTIFPTLIHGGSMQCTENYIHRRIAMGR